MYLNGMELLGIERVTEIHHTAVMNWIKETWLSLPDTSEESELPEITEIDELQTFIGSKKNKLWIWSGRSAPSAFFQIRKIWHNTARK